MSFGEEIQRYQWDEVRKAVSSKTEADVISALQCETRGLDDLMALLSPAAVPMLEEMAQASHQLTAQRFGRIIQMYAPIYLSSECINGCAYCGFNHHNQIKRATLTVDQAEQEGKLLRNNGFCHALLLTGESPHHVSVDYLGRVAQTLRQLFASISIEVYPMDTASYGRLIAKGVDGLTIYQETYNRRCYATVHPFGPKRNYEWRLGAPERGGQAGFRRLNIGALLGLADWRVEGVFMGMHAAYLMHRHWQSQVLVSFPRLRPAAGGYIPEHPVNDAEMVQLMCALRLFLPDAGIVLSTREPPDLRDNLIPLGVTHMSAGSRTAPGGYGSKEETEGQFEVSDHRTSLEVAQKITSLGYEPVWKDWDVAFLGPPQIS